MRLAILTTETPHHAYFVKALADGGHQLRVFTQTQAHASAYPVAHPFEQERDRYERDHWFAGRACALSEMAPTQARVDINDPAVLSALKTWSPDAVIVFGTARIRVPIINAFARRIVNLHGGDPETYRGLDTHLWAIWHRDFDGLVTTLHLLDEEIDHGAIVARKAISVRPNMPLHELRAENTRVCVDLVRYALTEVAQKGRFTAQPQRMIGRYYSAMPAVLKEICIGRFARYTETL